MNPEGCASPSELGEWLDTRYSSTQKGGTLIARMVTDLATHEKWLANPSSYRPEKCLNCHHKTLHIHDYRCRELFNEYEKRTQIIRFRCYPKTGCGATWQVLPAFLARHLWHRWPVVEQEMLGKSSETKLVKRPSRPTRERWSRRLAARARHLVQLLATSGEKTLERVATSVGLMASRIDVVLAYATLVKVDLGLRFAALAELVHRFDLGVRLM